MQHNATPPSTQLPNSTAAKIARTRATAAMLVRLLASDHDGEVLGAVRALKSTLLAAELDLHDREHSRILPSPRNARGIAARDDQVLPDVPRAVDEQGARVRSLDGEMARDGDAAAADLAVRSVRALKHWPMRTQSRRRTACAWSSGRQSKIMATPLRQNPASRPCWVAPCRGSRAGVDRADLDG
jgi:hypothetical protein